MKRAKLEHGRMHGEYEGLLKPEEPLYNKTDSGFDQQHPEPLLLRGNEVPVSLKGTSTVRQSNSHVPQSISVSTVSLPASGSRDQQCELRTSMKGLIILIFMSFGL